MFSHYILHNFEPQDQKRFERYLSERLEKIKKDFAAFQEKCKNNKALFDEWQEDIKRIFSEQKALKTAVQFRSEVLEEMADLEKGKTKTNKWVKSKKEQLWALKANVIFLEKNKLLPK